MRFAAAVELHLDHMQYLNSRPSTIANHRGYLVHLKRFLESQKIEDVTAVTPALMEQFRIYLFNVRTGKRSLGIRAQATVISIARQFFETLVEQGQMLLNVAGNVARPRIPQRLPPRLPTVVEIERMLRLIKIDTPIRYRDRTILEVFYATGIRQGELTDLKPNDFNQKHQTLYVVGKGLSDRTLPLPPRVTAILKEYIARVRPLLPKSEYLFPSRFGKRIALTNLLQMVSRHAQKARIKRTLTTHTFRHVLATELLRNGADLRSIQEYLGHKNIETTTLYSHVLGKDLKRVHGQTHPRERRRQ